MFEHFAAKTSERDGRRILHLFFIDGGNYSLSPLGWNSAESESMDCWDKTVEAGDGAGDNSSATVLNSFGASSSGPQAFRWIELVQLLKHAFLMDDKVWYAWKWRSAFIWNRIFRWRCKNGLEMLV